MKSEPAGKSQARGRFGDQPSSKASCSPSDIEIYGWQFRDEPVSIHMQIGVLERLQREIIHRLNLREPGDIAGVLIGRTVTEEGLAIIVEDYQLGGNFGEIAVPPSDGDQRMAGVITEWSKRNDARGPVGIFRSQKYGRPVIDGQDLSVAERLFPRTQNIFLLIRSAVDGEFVGMFFFRQAGVATVEEKFGVFPFDADILTARMVAPGPKLAVLPSESRETLETEKAADSNAALALDIPVEAANVAPPIVEEERRIELLNGGVLIVLVNFWKRLAPVFTKQWMRIRAIGSLLQGFAPRATSESATSPEPEAIEPLLLSAEMIEPHPSLANESALYESAEKEMKDTAPAEVPVWFAENPPSKSIRSWRSWLSIAATWVIAVGATMWCIDGRSPFSQSRPAVTETRPRIVFNPLGLQVDRTGGLLEIAWDRNTDLTVNSQGGFITLRDGNLLKQLSLDPSEIRTGRLYYEPTTADLGIRFEVAGEDGRTASESIRVVGAIAVVNHRQ